MKWFAAQGIKLVMVVALLVGLLGIPYWIASNAWSLMSELWDRHPFWAVLLLVPAMLIVTACWKWGYKLLAKVMMALGGLVDCLEG